MATLAAILRAARPLGPGGPAAGSGGTLFDGGSGREARHLVDNGARTETLELRIPDAAKATPIAGQGEAGAGGPVGPFRPHRIRDGGGAVAAGIYKFGMPMKLSTQGINVKDERAKATQEMA